MMRTTHFRTLDGLRGIAAITVVAYHFGSRSNLPAMMPHGYFAVDFFFVLSGFVIAHAYLGRLQTSMTATAFMVQRFIRLWPMLVPGTLLGAAMEFWRPNAGEPMAHLIRVVIPALFGSMALPWPFSTSMEQTIFPINGPVWSLFFKIVANLVFVVIATIRFSSFLIRGLVVASTAGLLCAAVTAGTVDVGPLLENWPGGLPRVLASFFIGVYSVRGDTEFPRRVHGCFRSSCSGYS